MSQLFLIRGCMFYSALGPEHSEWLELKNLNSDQEKRDFPFFPIVQLDELKERNLGREGQRISVSPCPANCLGAASHPKSEQSNQFIHMYLKV